MYNHITVDADIDASRLQSVAYVLSRHRSIPASCLRYAGELDGLRLVREWAKADRETFSRIMGIHMSPFDNEDLYRSYITPSYSFMAPFMANPALALPGRRETVRLSEIVNAVLSSCEGGIHGQDADLLHSVYMFKPHTEVVRNVFYECCRIGGVVQPSCTLNVTRMEILSETYSLHLDATAYSDVDESELEDVLIELQLEACRSAGEEPDEHNTQLHRK